MTENAGVYNVDSDPSKVPPWSEFKNSASLQSYSSGKYESPEPIEIRALLKKMDWDDEDVSKLVGAQYNAEKGRGSTTVRGWLRPKHSTAHRQISYAAWRLLLINANLAKS